MSKEDKAIEGKLKSRYLKIMRVFLILSIIFLIWAVFNIASVYMFGLGNKWAILTMNQWIIAIAILYAIFIVVVLLFIIHIRIIKKRITKKEKPKIVFHKGKKLHIFTQPKSAKGGIFSKTFITIDEENLLSVRFQMIPPQNLWGQKK